MIDTCIRCGAQIHAEGTWPYDSDVTWVDNSGGDVCGALGGNEPHVGSVHPFEAPDPSLLAER